MKYWRVAGFRFERANGTILSNSTWTDQRGWHLDWDSKLQQCPNHRSCGAGSHGWSCKIFSKNEGRFFYWAIVLITLILGINALEVAATQNFIAQFFNYLPNLFAAVIILVIGYLITIFLGQATLIAAVNAQMESAKPVSRAVRWFIIILSLTMALYHLGIAEMVIVSTLYFPDCSWRNLKKSPFVDKTSQSFSDRVFLYVSMVFINW